MVFLVDVEVHAKKWVEIAQRDHPFSEEYLKRIRDFIDKGCPPLKEISEPCVFLSEKELLFRLGCLGQFEGYFPYIAKRLGGKTLPVLDAARILAGIHFEYADSENLDPLFYDILVLLTIPIIHIVVDDPKARNATLKGCAYITGEAKEVFAKAWPKVQQMVESNIDKEIHHRSKYQWHRRHGPHGPKK